MQFFDFLERIKNQDFASLANRAIPKKRKRKATLKTAAIEKVNFKN